MIDVCKALHLTAMKHCLQAEYQRKMAQKQFEDQEREIQLYQKQMVRLERGRAGAGFTTAIPWINVVCSVSIVLIKFVSCGPRPWLPYVWGSCRTHLIGNRAVVYHASRDLSGAAFNTPQAQNAKVLQQTQLSQLSQQLREIKEQREETINQVRRRRAGEERKDERVGSMKMAYNGVAAYRSEWCSP
jgi:hypothetical protein